MGTMTSGTGADEQASFEILDIAHDAGIDFYDTAEMYRYRPINLMPAEPKRYLVAG